MTNEAELEALHHSDQRVVRTVDSLTPEQWSEPSVLPGWTRTHLVGHLALNAEGFARALDGVLEGRIVAIYDSNEARESSVPSLLVGLKLPV